MDDAVEKAVAACYDAVVTPQSWADALHDLCRSLDAACMMFYPDNADKSTLETLPISHDYKDFIDFYIEHKWYEGHYRAERGWPLMRQGRTVIEHDLASDEERRKLRHYNELYLPFEFVGFAGVGFRVEDRAWAGAMLRYDRQGHFSHEDAQALARLGPHFARMVGFSEKFALAQAASGLAALDQMSCAAVLLDWRGTVLRLNRRAEALLGTDLKLRQGKLAAGDAESDRRLQGLVRALLSRDVSLATFAPAPIAVRRTARRPLVVEALPVSGLIADVFQRSRALLTITDLDARPVPSAKRLQGLFGLTAAEARLAERLAAGEELKAIAESSGVAFATVRKQLDAIFAKTETHRQGELVALINRLPAG